MLKDLHWRPLDLRLIDSRLVLMNKVTYDIVTIPAPDYLVHNTRKIDQTSVKLMSHLLPPPPTKKKKKKKKKKEVMFISGRRN